MDGGMSIGMSVFVDRRQRQIKILDQGKVIEVIPIPGFDKDNRKVTMFGDGWKFIASIPSIKASEFSVFSIMLANLQDKNWIDMDRKKITQELQNGNRKNNQYTVDKAIESLIRLGIIDRILDPSNENTVRYRLNAFIGWKGDVEEWVNHIEERDYGNDPVLKSWVKSRQSNGSIRILV